ncbi:MAG: hypothetical protein IH910_01975 [Proteobacteria bacterium]|nr:hypothetical protein [Pseudomonadota bacterium]
MQDDSEITALLKDYPMPAANAAYFDQALVRATHEGSRRQRNRWVMTGFGSAIAAGLALWLIGGFFLTAPNLPETDTPGVPGITMTLAEPQTVNFVFASNTPLVGATLTIMLPEGVELVGFPGQREISWQTSLTAGRNLLPLRLIALSPMGGEVMATLEHMDRARTFRVRVDVI